MSFALQFKVAESPLLVVVQVTSASISFVVSNCFILDEVAEIIMHTVIVVNELKSGVVLLFIRAIKKVCAKDGGRAICKKLKGAFLLDLALLSLSSLKFSHLYSSPGLKLCVLFYEKSFLSLFL